MINRIFNFKSKQILRTFLNNWKNKKLNVKKKNNHFYNKKKFRKANNC